MSRLHAHLDVDGVEHEVHADHTTDSAGRPVTHVELREPDHGFVVVEALVEGHIGPVRVLATAHDLADAVPGGTRRWTRFADIPGRRGVKVTPLTDRDDGGPAKARYDLDGSRISRLYVDAYVTRSETEAVRRLVRRYCTGRGVTIGKDAICRHEEPGWRHELNCILLAADQLCGALQVEVQALLADQAGP